MGKKNEKKKTEIQNPKKLKVICRISKPEIENGKLEIQKKVPSTLLVMDILFLWV